MSFLAAVASMTSTVDQSNLPGTGSMTLNVGNPLIHLMPARAICGQYVARLYVVLLSQEKPNGLGSGFREPTPATDLPCSSALRGVRGSTRSTSSKNVTATLWRCMAMCSLGSNLKQ